MITRVSLDLYMMSSRKCTRSHGHTPLRVGLTALPCSLLHRTQPFDRSNIRTANEFVGSQVGSQPRQTCGDARRRPATVAAGHYPGERCLDTRGDRPGLLRIEGSGVQIPSAPPVSAGQRPTKGLKLVSLGNDGEPIADLSAAGGLTCALFWADCRSEQRARPLLPRTGRIRWTAGHRAGPVPGIPSARAPPLGPQRRGCRQPLRTTRTARSRQPAIRDYIQQVTPGSPREAPAAARTANWSLCLSRPRNEHPGRNRSRIPSKATGSARLAAHQPSAAAPRPRKTSPGNVLLGGCKGASSRTRPKMPAPGQPGEQNPAGR